MLSDSEQRSWDERERSWAEDMRGEKENIIRRRAVGPAGIAIVLAVIGAPLAALAVLVVAVLAWSLSSYWRDIGAAFEATLVPMDGWIAEPDEAPRLHRTG